MQPSTLGSFVRLQHGTTRLRAEHILRNGPDPNNVLGGDTAHGFSTAPAVGPFLMGTPDEYARLKAKLFPQEGGPAILEIDVPKFVVTLAVHPGGEVWFGANFGLEELLAEWQTLSKRIVTP